MAALTPRPRGLYDPRFEHDACGIGFVAQLSGAPSHEIVTQALTAVGNMEHRGGIAADGKSGDGAGVLTAIPRAFFARELERLNISYPVAELAVGMFFLPQDDAQRAAAQQITAEKLHEYGFTLLGWRAVPVDKGALGARALATCPVIAQALVGRAAGAPTLAPESTERALYLARKCIEAACSALDDVYISSLSCRTLVYKGMFISTLVGAFYPDLRDPLYESAFATYHQRYSTNTFPTWGRAQPFHMLAHNGEINTLEGNVTWMRAREAEWRQADQRPTPDDQLASARMALAGGHSSMLDGGSALATAVTQFGPVVDTGGSDSAKLDNVLELLVMGGRDIRHALTMLVPEAWERVSDMNPAWRAFYQYHAGLSEPWDGPAALAFCDGNVIGLALDRNGLRPARYLITEDGLVVCGSEVGAVTIDEARIVRKGKVGPGQMIACDLRTGEFQTNAEIKSHLAAQQPYAAWLAQSLEVLSPASAAHYSAGYERESSASLGAKSALLGELQHVFGYTAEELAVVMRPMATNGQEPVGSMGDDTPTAALSEHARPLYNYFKQRFAEVTNPPLDPLREELVMSLSMVLGRRGNMMEDGAHNAHLLRIASPVLNDEHLALLRAHRDPAFASATLPALFPVAEGERAMVVALDHLCSLAEDAIKAGKTILILSDRGVSEERAPIPALLALGAVHQCLTRKGLRRRASLVVESGEPREVHHIACLVGMGAEAVNPYLALAAVRALVAERETKTEAKGTRTEGEANALSPDEAEVNYIHALEKGLLKVMSKMGVATVDSYCGAQLFEAVGVSDEVIARSFTHMPSRIKGVGYRQIAARVLAHHDQAFARRAPLVGSRTSLPHPGYYKFKKDGEYHAFAPPVVHALQKATKSGTYEDYQAYSTLVNSRPPTELRDLLALTIDDLRLTIANNVSSEVNEQIENRKSKIVNIEEVEPIERILVRFSTAAMSLGSTSSEAHETISIAMNRLGALSNSGEGGEDPARYGNERNSTIKQIASGRFGVTPAYLASAQELQIKVAQGSKPGEGGQLPGHKVTEEIARVRHTTPGVQLISPPPHHDIYSIEDLSQLIYDLKQVNPQAAVSVKLVAEAGVGTIAAGVAKGGADVVHISGHSGGTGASPLSSMKNAGVNWELGLAEAQHTLVVNGLRAQVRVRVDGGFKTGRDVLIAAMLGADEFSFGTAALVAEGCIMARACHNNTCPVGIATQRPELRAKFTGTPEMVMHFFGHIAQEVRELLAALGVRSLAEIVGRADLLRQTRRGSPAADTLDLAPLLARVDEDGDAISNGQPWNGIVETSALNATLLAEFARYECSVLRSEVSSVNQLKTQNSKLKTLELSYPITNVDRTVGATLSGAIGARYGDAGLPDGTVTVRFAGSAGQSFGAFNASGVRLLLDGEANDYVGKGMGGGEIVVRPAAAARYATHENTIIGNTVLYGATGGALFAAGRAGERFAVRNSGAVVVVEGVGDHGCEYMTGGVVLVLGETGRNFGAGMTGGLAYIFDEAGRFSGFCNTDMVALGALNEQDEANISALLARHHALTGSARAADLLARWADVRGQFVRVQPRDVESVRIPATMERLRERVAAR